MYKMGASRKPQEHGGLVQQHQSQLLEHWHACYQTSIQIWTWRSMGTS
jgi:hypothetical protein